MFKRIRRFSINCSSLFKSWVGAKNIKICTRGKEISLKPNKVSTKTTKTMKINDKYVGGKAKHFTEKITILRCARTY